MDIFFSARLEGMTRRARASSWFGGSLVFLFAKNSHQLEVWLTSPIQIQPNWDLTFGHLGSHCPDASFPCGLVRGFVSGFPLLSCPKRSFLAKVPKGDHRLFPGALGSVAQ